ncbi:hypothetical protein CBR_g48537 [Chara braunii]|uniref:BFN domain-containing protein n=1 Tax=Chara braunii TaxID=69332 RepID=A0A388M311_CHABU|nr:hypothetical protein CBR_g48537 [Chara braunii]|eukprot:GBG88926.1 hypothetical protein CBR_g48537 [Chara braunii]
MVIMAGATCAVGVDVVKAQDVFGVVDLEAGALSTSVSCGYVSGRTSLVLPRGFGRLLTPSSPISFLRRRCPRSSSSSCKSLSDASKVSRPRASGRSISQRRLLMISTAWPCRDSNPRPDLHHHSLQSVSRRPGREPAHHSPSRGGERGGLCVRAALDNESAENSDGQHVEDLDEYMEARVVDAVRMVPVRGHLYMTMADGTDVEVIHTNPGAGRLLYHSGTPTIFLSMVADDELMLPIVVGDMAIGMVVKGMRQEKGVRPNFYELMRELVAATNNEVKMVRVTQRVLDTYHACVCLGKPGQSEMVMVDARPSDAINLAIRCKVPIYVNRGIVLADGVRMVYAPSCPRADTMLRSSDGGNTDSDQNDPYAEEIGLMRSMLTAAMEERYADAARLRDELNLFRQQGRRRHTRQGQL